ncbi:MAG TPA: FAD-linked oxidase C-terminal domain-containing protein, partial [Flavobacteriales bacterium]|nr:FAD-linked oxidase C-terminal domain-containing protein [Flavobacteriales bacterium]
KPGIPQEVSKILTYCNKHKVPVTPIGARTGLSGGALCVQGGVGLSMERFNKILHLDEKNLQVTVEPGVITQVLQEAVIEKKLFYPVDPSSRGSCFIGGNIAENSGGPRAVKYGVTKDYVLNLEVVLPTGEITWTGANTLKNSTGYNLTQLMVGSEGTLGIITKIVLKLIPYPSQNVLMLVPFKSAVNACKAVSAVFREGITPSAMEFMERDAIDWTLKYVDGINIKVEPHHMAHLLIEVDGFELEPLYPLAEKIVAILQEYECDEVLFADTAEQKDQLWRMRRRVGEAVKSNSIYKEEDTVVPRYALPVLLEGVKSIGAKYGFKSVCYGHAGDGNLHINIIKGDLSDGVWKNELPKGIVEIFELTKKLGGTLSGEHGIGFVQKNYMPIVFDKVSLDLMKGIKNLFDPNGILNPGKIFPDK